MRTQPAVLLLTVLAAASQGCATSDRADGVPPKAKRVASGSRIEFVTPQEGVLYLVADGKTTVVRRAAAGHRFRAIGDPTPDDDVSDAEMRFDHAELYFEPVELEPARERKP